jgi:hypothetical protein
MRKVRRLAFLAGLLMILLSRPLLAFSPLDIGPEGADAICLNVDMRYAPGLSLSYYRSFALGVPGRVARAGAELGMPLLHPDPALYRARLVFETPLFEGEGLNVLCRAALWNQGFRNFLDSQNAFGAEAAVRCGWFGADGHVALDIGFNKGIATYLRHSEQYRRQYPQAAEGWLRASGGSWMLGLDGGFAIADKTALGLELGYVAGESLLAAPYLPVYACLSAALRF